MASSRSQQKQLRNEEEAVKAFVSDDPNGRYSFDSERDSMVSELCRGTSGNGPDALSDCVKLHMHSTQLFAAMQKQGFFCALPSDPGQTHMECKPLPK
ncbi:hypothetical protein BKA70DRAFT_27736 [Coprinopsis sp. MPI-PUGE-AT-0042]|nr:hypothetical protein BKA70DRAFT_27736 [Coprinopsis sp. MPI-PUGE-AT-0042]